MYLASRYICWPVGYVVFDLFAISPVLEDGVTFFF